MARLWAQGLIQGAGNTQNIFQDLGRNAPNVVRVFNVWPTNSSVPFDAQAEITDVFYLLKGEEHVPGDVGDLQVNVTVQNKAGGPWGPGAGGPFLAYQIWIAEI